MNPRPHLIPYRKDIDGLRAVAVLSVVFFHAFPPLLGGGFTGVDVFFVISGFIITAILFKSLEQNQFSLSDFYERRARRLFPALVVVFAFCLVTGWFVLFSDEYAELGKSVLAGAGFIQNFNLLFESGYFDNASTLKPLLHIWSLSVEEQFYFFWPILLMLAWRKRLNIMAVLLVVASISFSLNLYLTHFYPTFAYYLSVSRFWELMAGAYGANLLRKHEINEKIGLVLPAIGFAIVIIGFFAISKDAAFPGWKALFPVLGTLLVLIGNQRSAIARLLSSSPLVLVGKISYPLYLWHWVFLAFIRISVKDGTFRDAPISWRIGAVLFSMIFGYITYRYIEQPIRRGEFLNKLNILPKKTPALLSGLSLFSIGATGGVVFAMEGLPERIKIMPNNAIVLFKPYPHRLENSNCRNKYPSLKGSWSCLLSKPIAPDILLIGDSHAHQYYDSMARLLPEHAVMNYSQPGCFPFSRSFHECDEVLNKMLDFVEKEPAIKTIVLTGYFSFLEGGFKYGNVEGSRVANDHPSRSDREAFMASSEKVIQRLKKLNIRILILRDIPDLVFSPRSCVDYSNPLISVFRGLSEKRSYEECGIGLEVLKKRNEPYDKDLNEILLKHREILVLDPKPVFCNGDFCRAISSQGFFYWNSDHLTIEGADLVVSRFVGELRGPTRKR